MEENAGAIASKFKENTFPWIFWQSQLKAAKMKNMRSMRWHPLMIRSNEITILITTSAFTVVDFNVYKRWSIYLRHLSGKGYALLRESGYLKLPSERTLRDYTFYNKTQIGFSTATDQKLLQLTKDYLPFQKMIGITIDEMYISEGVVYDRKSGQILGFTDLGDITNHLIRYK